MATRTKAKAVTAADRHVAITNLGEHVKKLVWQIKGFTTDFFDSDLTPEQAYKLGAAVEKALRAGVKAQIEGRQSTAQVTARLDAARKAVNRALARMVAG